MKNDNSGIPELPADLAAALRRDVERQSDRPEGFWVAQRTRIRARIAERSETRPSGYRLMTAAALALCCALLLVAPAGRAPEVPRAASIDPDQELLQAVEHTLATGTPEALEPLTLMFDSNSAPNTTDPTSKKEHRNEN